MCQDMYQERTWFCFCGHSIPINLKKTGDRCTFFHSKAQHTKQENKCLTKRGSGWRWSSKPPWKTSKLHSNLLVILGFAYGESFSTFLP